MEQETNMLNGEDKEEKQTKTTLRVATDLFWDMKQQAAEERRNLTEVVNQAFYDYLVRCGKRKAKK